ncbi:MAG: FHA domain-containing protein [Chloroflexi bacterium]|jgi:pSer/pThr/pTyr-binding forkhead associated (FHA) protein|nr:FHA domain-containing protein [Anaerolineaceae bacterium]NMB89165.1 FHA domain-containing protein [Chloroflexota bacterium]
MEHLNADLPVLIGQTGPLSGQRWVIDQSMVVGRDAACSVVVPDRQVSRYHARLTPEVDGMLLEDLGSKNGTYCNGERVSEPVKLQDGDVLQIALVQSFIYLSSDATMPMEGQKAVLDARPSKRLFLDVRSRRVWIGHFEVVPPLSAQQFRLLQALYDQQGEVVPRHEVISAVWGSDEATGVSEQAIDALVRRLRDRLSSIEPEWNFIVTVRGHGLRLDNPSE